MADDAKGPSFVVVGAGSIGGFVGVLLVRAGFRVRFLVRDNERSCAQREVLGRRGLTALGSADPDFRAELSPEEAEEAFTTDESCLAHCSCVLVATKRTGNAAVHAQLAAQGVKGPVVFLQNGLRIRDDLGPTAYEAIECVVRFNTVMDAGEGTVTLVEPLEDALLVLDGGCPSATAVAAQLSRTPVATVVAPDFRGVQCGKLLLNMTNSVNALSGLALLPMFMEASYRRVLAASISEAEAVFRAAGFEPKATSPKDGFLLRWFVTLLRAPQWLFAATMGRKLRGRGEGRTSMAQDLLARRVPTEVDFLNGEVVRLGREHGVPTPVNEALVELVKEAEAANAGCPCIAGADLLAAIGLRPVVGGLGGRLLTARSAAGCLALAAVLGPLLVRVARPRL